MTIFYIEVYQIDMERHVFLTNGLLLLLLLFFISSSPASSKDRRSGMPPCVSVMSLCVRAAEA